MSSETVDVGMIVAEVEADVRRRRAAGDYPPALLHRLSTEFHVESDDDAPEALALIQASRPLRSDHPGIGAAIMFAKRVVRRLLAWYVQPVADDQTRFNTAAVRELRLIERRLQRLETPWVRPPGSPAADLAAEQLLEGVAAARADALARLLGRAPPGPRLVLGPASPATTPLPGHDTELRFGDPLDHLAQVATSSLSAVVLAGVLPRLSACELLRVVPLAADTLRSGGLLVADAPRPEHASLPADPSALEPDMVRWVAPSTAALLCEAAGLERCDLTDVGKSDREAQGPWFVVTAWKPPA